MELYVSRTFRDNLVCNKDPPSKINNTMSVLANEDAESPKGGTTSPLGPRMAQLETLEAKMASIEVSLSTAQRRKSSKKGPGSVSSTCTRSATTYNTLNKSEPSNKEIEILRHVLRESSDVLPGQLKYARPLEPAERKIIESRLNTLKHEEEMRRGNIRRVMDAIHAMDKAADHEKKTVGENEANIDVRIRRAELEYELGREELALLGVREEARALQLRLETRPPPTLFSCLQADPALSNNSNQGYCLKCATLEYDPKSPSFGAGTIDDRSGLFVLWTADGSGLKKGDRIIEINGKLTLASVHREDLSRLLSVCPTRVEIVVLRQWSPPTSFEDFLRRENLRLTHRISYLEDQVAELLSFKEKTLTKQPQIEVFQKGSQVTLISSPESVRNMKMDRQQRDSDSDWKQVTVGPSQKYHEVDRKQYSEIPRRISRVYIHSKSTASLDRTNYSDLEKGNRREMVKERSVESSCETSCPRYKAHRDRSVKSLDLDEDLSHQRIRKPAPPKKPLRLSMHRATSLQNVELGLGKIKRPYLKLEKGQEVSNGGYPWPSQHREKWC